MTFKSRKKTNNYFEMFKHSRILRISLLYIFPLFLVGIFFVTQINAQLSNIINARVGISVCGNGISEGGEDCDNSDFNSYTCANYGYDTGSLVCNVDCSVDTSDCSNSEPDDPGGGGGGGTPIPAETKVTFSGRAYPLSEIFILKDGQLAIQTIAGQDANFSASLNDLSAGNYVFSLYTEDINDNRSASFTFSVYLSEGAETLVSGIFLAPTIDIDKSQVKKGDNIAIFGQTTPESEVTIVVNSDVQHSDIVNSDENGIYLHNFNTTVLEMGDHITKSRTDSNGEVSNYGQALSFIVGDTNIFKEDEPGCGIRADLNGDCRVDLVDFSILAYWYKKPSPPLNNDLNNDGMVDIIDFSILAFYWTG